MGLATAHTLFAPGAYILEDIEFRKALFIPDHENPKIQVVLDPEAASFEIYSQSQSAKRLWSLHANGKLRRQQDSRAPQEDLAEIRRRCTEALSGTECYAQFRPKGFHYGPCFQGITRLWRGAGEALGQIEAPDALNVDEQTYYIHPAILDACFQALIAIDTRANDSDDANGAEVFLPVGIDSIRVYRSPGVRLWSHARIARQQPGGFEGDITLLDDDGNVLVDIHGFRVKALDQSPNTAVERLDDWLYETQWRPQERDTCEQTAPAGHWLIFADSGGFGQALARAFEDRAATCTLVIPGDTYRVIEAGRWYQINPQQDTHFQRLLDEMSDAAFPACRGIVHCWSLNASAQAAPSVATLDAAQELGSLSVMRLTQALARSGAPPQVWLVTRGAQLVGERQTSVAIAQAPLWGLARVIGYQEYVGLWGGAVDLDPQPSPDEAALLAEEALNADGEDQIAFRDGRRYIARLERSGNLSAPLPAQFRPDGSYIITGGFGALGALVAHWMVDHGARRLILMGRTALPPRTEWNNAAPGSPQAERIALIRELERKGASVHVAAIDIADEAQLAAFLEHYRQEGWPPIRGVIYSAGVVRDQLLLEMDSDSFNAVLRPKMIGAWLLHHLLEQTATPLDFFVLFSSVASLVTSTGQGNYAAGNAFLDALAHHRRAQGLPALSINWGPWAVGMVLDLNLIEHYARRGMDAIAPEPGMQILGRLLGQNPAQVAVVSANWPVVLEYYPQSPPLFAHLGVQDAATDDNAGEQGATLLQRLRQAAPPERQELIEQHLLDLLARVLRLDRARLDREQPLNTLGLDSMMATELKNRIEISLETPLSVVDLLRGFSIAQLAAQLGPQIPVDPTIEELLAGAENLPIDLVQQLASQADAETLAQALADIEQLSEEEAQALLDIGSMSAHTK
jgi:acyl transferase domain-containing protein